MKIPDVYISLFIGCVAIAFIQNGCSSIFSEKRTGDWIAVHSVGKDWGFALGCFPYF